MAPYLQLLRDIGNLEAAILHLHQASQFHTFSSIIDSSLLSL